MDMKTLLAILLTLTLLAGAMVATLPITSADCDPNTDPTCKQQCPRNEPCPCIVYPWCTPEPTYAGKPTRTPPPVSTQQPGDSDPLAGLVGRMRTIDFTRLLEGAP